jgi:hypothetical protein
LGLRIKANLYPFIFGAVVCACASTKNPESKILPHRGQDPRNVPHVVEFRDRDGALLLYGSRHSVDPNDPQTADIQREWARFGPTIAYNEGGNPPAETTVERSVERYGEAGLVRSLAAWNRVPVVTFEPTREQEVADLLRNYTPEQVKVFLALRGYLTLRRSKQERTAEAYLTEVLGILNATKGVQGSPNDPNSFSASYSKLFPGNTQWQDVPEEWFDPTRSLQYTNEAARNSGLSRDKHIFGVLLARVRRGERVMAVIGASHVPALMPGFTEVFGKPIRERHGIKET